jgi:excisionase family DNA binding protein
MANAQYSLRTVRKGLLEPTKPLNRLLDTEEAARLLRIHPKTLRRNARRGEIPATRVGRLWRFRASVLNEWLERLAS